MAIMHSRYAELRKYYSNENQENALDIIPDNHAHPLTDYKDRIALFHNGSIANYTELKQELALNHIPIPKDHDMQNLTDSQLITALISQEMDQGQSLKEALKNVVEKKLLGTYRLAVMEMKNPQSIYFVKNCGDFILGQGKKNDEIIVSTSRTVFNQDDLKHRFIQIKIPNN